MVRLLKRILLVIGLILAGLILFLAGSVVIDGIAGRNRIQKFTNLTIPGTNGNPDVRAYVVKPQGSGPFPAVIMIHEFFGLNESILGKAKGLAEEGYLVVAPDTFRGSTTSWIPRAIFQVISTPPERINADLDSVYAWLETQPDVERNRIGVLGFCYGGRASLAYSLHNRRLAATVIFYGSPETDSQVLQALPAPVLGIFGGADNSIPLDHVRAFEIALEQAGIPHEITIYDGQPHAFVTDIEAIRAGGVQGQAWAQMLRFLEQNLKVGDARLRPGSGVTYTAPIDFAYYFVLAYEHTFGRMSHSH